MSKEIWVGPSDTYRSLDAAVAASVAGDTIYVRAGVYSVGDTTINHALTIIGVGGEVILTSDRTLDRDRGLLVAQADLTVENITFRGAWSATGSAAAIVVEGGDLIVRNSKFEQNEIGILARDSATGSLLIEDSRFAGNGWGDATTAAVVAGRGTEMLTVADSYFLENAAGHHIVSRAAATVIERSILDDGSAGSAGSSIDLPDGGRVVIEDNVIRKGTSGSEQTAIDYGKNAAGAHGDSSLSVLSNVISDASGHGTAVVNGLAGTVADVNYNVTYGLGDVVTGPAIETGNVEEALATVPDTTGTGGTSGSAYAAAGAGSGSSHGVTAFSSESGSSVSGVTVANTGTSAKAAGTMEIDHVFARGEMLSDVPLQVLLNGVLTPVTLTVLSTYDDGSIRQASLSFEAPIMAAGATLNATLVRGSLTPSDPVTGDASGSGTGTGSGNGNGTGSDSGSGSSGSGSNGGGDPGSNGVSSGVIDLPQVITTVTTSTGLLITGTSGSDVFEVTPLDKVFRTIVGGDGNDKVDFKTGYLEYYKVTRNSDGSIDVVESHATGTKTHIVGVETIKLGNALYDVATGTTTPIVNTSAGSSSSNSGSSSGTGGSSSTPAADSVSFNSSGGSHASGANIVDVAVVNSATTARPTGYWTFGQVFKEGDLPAGEHLYAVINGQKVALQVDVKNTWDDGSVKHAVLTVKTPALAAGASSTIDLMVDANPVSQGPALTVNQMLLGNLDVKLELSNLNGGTVTLDAKTVLQQAIQVGTVKTWLVGENAIEVAVRAKINDQLEAEFDIRYHADGTYTTDVIVRNDWAFTATSKVNYNVAIRENGVTTFSQANVNQNQYSTWHEVTTRAASLGTVYGKFDGQYLKDSGAVPAYDLSYDPSSATLASAASKLATTDRSLMGSAGVTMGMASTGEREDIGPLPEWTSQYLRVMDAKTTENLFAKADASGAVPWHIRDNATGSALTLEDHPKFWFDGRAVGRPNTEAPTGLAAGTQPYVGTGWSPEAAHQPSLTYLPYLISGSQYYLSETTSEVSWLLANANWNKATFELVTSISQVRGQAWMLRDLSNLVFALPESDPDYAYYKGVLEKNLDHLVKTFITNGAHAKYGELDGFFGEGLPIAGSREPGSISPWMEDFYAIVLGTLAERGYAQAVDLLNWQSNFLAQRFLSEDFNHFMGSGYRTIINNPYTGEALTNWSEVNKYTQDIMYNDVAPIVQDGYPTGGSGYAALARASMASLSRIGNLDGAEAYGYMVEQTPNMSYGKEGKYGIAFRFGPNGAEVALSDHKVGTAGNDAMTGSARADVLVGGKGNDTISGGDGQDALYGGDGNDSLVGGAGNDVIFGGAGNDTLVGGAGDDTLRGGEGADLFVFGPDCDADTLFDFSAGKAGTDVIDLSDFVDAGLLANRDGVAGIGLNDLLFDPAGAAKPYLIFANGDAILNFGHGDSITLKGIGSSTQLYSDDFVF